MMRLALKFLIDLGWWGGAALAAVALFRGVKHIPPAGLALYFGAALLLAAVVIHAFRLHRQSWHRMGVDDLVRLAFAVAVWTAALATTLLYAPAFYAYETAPVEVALIAGMGALLLLGGVRVTARLVFQTVSVRESPTSHRVLIIGAGDSGTMMAREMLRHPEKGLKPIGFLDDDRNKARQSFVGVPVLGAVSDLPEAAERVGANQILIAAPSAPGEFVKRVVALARESRLSYRIVPPLHDLLSGAGLAGIREVAIDDLLQREPVKLELDQIAGYLSDRVILVSGAGGSIGAEIVVQVSRFKPRKVVLLGRGEHSLFMLERHLERTCPALECVIEVCDVRRRDALGTVFARHAPQVVFHVAAHKHVPMMEANPWEAVFNNIGGTATMVDASLEQRVSHFVNVSTDKAVNPTSVMGATKRVAEYLVEQAASKALPGASYVSVRFGNVLGSRGSVIPLFQEQIRRGGPVTVTHPEMTRYFMTISEAAQLVLQAGGMQGNGQVYVLDMGRPTRIVDLAEELIRLSGFVPGQDIEVRYTGIRPGEKLHEELLMAEEGAARSDHEAIFVARNPAPKLSQFDGTLDALFDAARSQDATAIRAVLRKLVPSAKLGPSSGFTTET